MEKIIFYLGLKGKKLQPVIDIITNISLIYNFLLQLVQGSLIIFVFVLYHIYSNEYKQCCLTVTVTV